MRNKLAAILLPLAVLALSGPAQARVSEKMQIKGSILREKEVTLPEGTLRHKVVELKTEDGRRIAVDLGPTDKLKSVPLTIGATISVNGYLLRVGDRPVLFAERLSPEGGTTINIERPGMKERVQTLLPEETEEARAEKAMTAAPQRLSGRVVHLKTVTVKPPKAEAARPGEAAGAGEEAAAPTRVRPISHQVVMLRTNEGENVIVDLGPKDKLKQVRMRTGSRIQVQARPVRIGDRLVLLASRVTSNGKTVRIVQPKPMSAMRSEYEEPAQPRPPAEGEVPGGKPTTPPGERPPEGGEVPPPGGTRVPPGGTQGSPAQPGGGGQQGGGPQQDVPGSRGR